MRCRGCLGCVCGWVLAAFAALCQLCLRHSSTPGLTTLANLPSTHTKHTHSHPHTPARQLTAADPYTAPAFRAATGLPAAAPWSFEDVQGGCLPASGYDLVICSFAMHLLDPSRLFATLNALARAARWLLILSPHKRPPVGGESGWRLAVELVEQRVHARLYESAYYGGAA